ncbi:MAG TPA: hypothetical protein VF719_05435, partial [Abditibacteriaceae bacterium]
QMAFTPHYLRGFLRLNELLADIPVLELGRGKHPTRAEHKTEGRGISIAPTADGIVKVRLHLKQRGTRRMVFELMIHAVAQAEVRVWNVQLRGHGGDFGALARLAGEGNQPHGHIWRAHRVANFIEIDVPREALGPDEEIALLVSAEARAGKTVLDQTEIGVVRLASVNSPDVNSPPEFQTVAISDPRFARRVLPRRKEKKVAV